MHKTWIVVADSARARIFKRDGRWQELDEFRDLAHPESRLRNSDLRTGGRGEQRESMGQSRHDSDWENSPADTEAARFAQEVARALQQGRKEGAYEKLVLVAAPAFLGRLRDKLDPATAHCVVQALDKNWARQPTGKIQSLLERHF